MTRGILTSWTRVEPDSRDPTLNDGLEARIADPLWLLARQAAFGELTGQDAALPVEARLRAHVSRLTRLRAGPPPEQATAGQRLTPDARPLERLVEAGSAQPGDVGALESAKAGLRYLRWLEVAPGAGNLSEYRKGLLAAYPFPPRPRLTPASPVVAKPPPDPTSPDLRVYVGRVPDGAALYAAFSAAKTYPSGGLPSAPALGGANRTVVTNVARAWCRWFESVYLDGAGPPQSWNPARNEHSFSVAAPGPAHERVFSTSEYASGSLDWHDFDLGGASAGAQASDVPAGDQPLVITMMPSPVRYRGMPAARFWELEDASVDFGDIDAPPEDVTSSLIIEFVLRYGNDHFLFPVPLPVGAVCRVDSVAVRDTFGQTTLIRPVAKVDGAAGPFRLFEHAWLPSGAGGREPLFMLFPTVAAAIASAPLEDVGFLRDQIADVVWAVEHTAPGPSGLPVDRNSPAPEVTLTAAQADALVYRLRTELPGNWFPLLPPETGEGSSLTLSLVPGLDKAPAPAPWSEVLAELEQAQLKATGGLRNEEVTREGTRVTRSWRYARWIDGSQLTWSGRTAGPGRGTGASGLRFDLALPRSSSAPRKQPTRMPPTPTPREGAP
jgi:hypothetical protein